MCLNFKTYKQKGFLPRVASSHLFPFENDGKTKEEKSGEHRSERGLTMAQATLDKQEVERIDREFETAFKRGDMATVASLYAEDARVMPPGSEMVQGRQAIEQFWRGAQEQMGVKEITLTILEVATSGNIGYEVGTATLKIEPSGGQATTAPVKYLVAWKRQADGAWRLAVDIWNSNVQA
jgi:uncharacterized protein (TIGR02246 family)